jgi:hypothetical protein
MGVTVLHGCRCEPEPDAGCLADDEVLLREAPANAMEVGAAGLVEADELAVEHEWLEFPRFGEIWRVGHLARWRGCLSMPDLP